MIILTYILDIFSLIDNNMIWRPKVHAQYFMKSFCATCMRSVLCITNGLFIVFCCYYFLCLSTTMYKYPSFYKEQNLKEFNTYFIPNK